MAVDERRRKQLHDALERTIGPEEAVTMMELVPGSGWAEVATRADLDAKIDQLRAELRAEMAVLRAELRTEMAELRTDMADRLDAQTKTLFRTFMVTNGVMVLTVASLAFSAARFA